MNIKVTLLFLVSMLVLLGEPSNAKLQHVRRQTKRAKKKWKNRIDKEVNLEDVPIKVHRTARQMLEDQGGTELAPPWEGDASFDPTVRVLYRVDIHGPAYYELRVTVDEVRQGFIIVSSGDHDHPAPHWSSEGLSPTEVLDEEAGDAEIAKYYKLDSLSYVAEDKEGNIVAQTGELPMKIESEVDPEDVEEESMEVDDTMTDEEANRLLAKTQNHPIHLTPWGDTVESSWRELKAHGAENYQAMTSSLKKSAAEDWDTERRANTYGEGLVEGETVKIPLLFPDAKIRVSGPGAQRVEIEQLEKVINLQVIEADEERELSLRIIIKYGNGLKEVLRFTIVPNNQVPEERRKLGSWTPWTYFWAGTHDDQRWYGQIRSRSSPNTSSCASGCGATAWTMLMGWIDYRAYRGDSKWSNRKCLFPGVAPQYWNSAVKNMMWRIRNYIGTFCWSGQGATYPWKMNEAYKYVKYNTNCGYHIKTNYNSVGISTDGLRKIARDTIRDHHTPVIIGTGWLSHYPLAYGYAWRKRTVRKCFIFCWNDTEYSRWFYVNQGWGSSGSKGWVSADTWFAGRFYAS